MKDKYSYLCNNVLLFTISSFVPKILSFILVPIYTSFLTTAEYGISDLITTTVTLMIPIFTLGIQDAVMRFALDKAYKKEDVFSIAVKIIVGGAFIIFIGTILVSFLDIVVIDNIYLLFFFLMYVVSAMHNSVSLFCRGIDKVKVITISSIINAFITLVSNILFLVVFKWGLVGYLLANTLGSVVALIYCFFGAKLYRYIKLRTSIEARKEMIAFSFPLIFSVISWWINSASDRYILTWMSGVAVSGVYAVAYKIPNVLAMFQNVFAQAWSISAVKEFDNTDSQGFMGNMYTIMNAAMVLCCSLLMILNIPMSKILFANDFFEAWKMTPPLLVCVVFNAMALFIGSIFTAVKDTKTLSISTITGAIVNCICNFLFIYLWAGYGAALATLVGNVVILVMRHHILKKHIKLKVNWKREVSAWVLLVCQMFLALWGLKFTVIQCIIFVFIILMYKKEIIILKEKLLLKLKLR